MIQIKILLITNIFKYFYECFQAFFQFYEYIIYQLISNTLFYPQIIQNIKYKEYFTNCICVLDSVYIVAWVLASKVPSYQN